MAVPKELDDLVSRLTALNERELIDTLNRAFEVLGKRSDGNGPNPTSGVRYCLVQTVFEKGEDDEPYVEFLGVPSEPYLAQPWDEALESGGCPTCGVIVACTDKLATCPVCGTRKVECT